MLKKFALHLVLILFVSMYAFPLFASFRPVPGTAPGLTPKVEIVKERRVKQTKKIQNTPALEWQMIKKGKSIEVFHNGTGMVFVQKINLQSGATLSSIFRFHSYDTNSGEPLYERFSPQNEIKNFESPPFTYINGQFFDPKRSSTPFSFGFKLKNTILTAGADNRDEKKMIFSYSSRGARMIPYDWNAFQNEQANFALVNLTLDDSNEDTKYMGRTYICIIQPDTDGYSQLIMTFSFLRATEAYALTIMTSWGCERKYISKLDSSASTVFGLGLEYYRGYSHHGHQDQRKLPQLITFYDE